MELNEIKITDRHELFKFIVENIDYIEPEENGGSHYENCPFELNPRDFLKFAKSELSGDEIETRNVVNALSHLKRALECQIDWYLHCLDLHKTFKKNKLGFNTKLYFISASGIIETESIDRLNKMRNKLEHEYKVPEIHDVNVYYDLTWAIVKLVEISMHDITNLSVSVRHDTSNEYRFEFSYSKGVLTIKNGGCMYIGSDNEVAKISFTEDREFFCYAFKVLRKLSFFWEKSCIDANFLEEINP